jgi:hypothetical protein
MVVEGGPPFFGEMETLVMFERPDALPSGWQVLAEKGADFVPVSLGFGWVARIHNQQATAAGHDGASWMSW